MLEQLVTSPPSYLLQLLARGGAQNVVQHLRHQERQQRVALRLEPRHHRRQESGTMARERSNGQSWAKGVNPTTDFSCFSTIAPILCASRLSSRGGAISKSLSLIPAPLAYP